MYANNYFNVATQQVTRLPINMMKADGYFRGTTAARWLQFHDSCTTPANGAVPIREEPLNTTAAFYFEFKNGAQPFTEGLFVGVSTSEGTWTASADTMDIAIETDIQPLTTTLVGDKTTARNTLTAWSQATGFQANPRKVLYAAIFTELLGDYAFVLGYSDDATTSNPQFILPLIPNQTRKFQFGSNGSSFVSATLPPLATPTSANPTNGCTIVVVSGATLALAQAAIPLVNSKTAPVGTANAANMLAITN